MALGQRNREEVVNTQLAIFISRLGFQADAETIHERGDHRPDVLLILRGLRVVIEGKFSDVPNARSAVSNDVNNRIRAGIGHIGVAVVYPPEFRQARTTEILGLFEAATLQFKIVAEGQPNDDWFDGTATRLMDALRRAHEGLVRDDIVEQTAQSLQIRMQGVADLWEGNAGTLERLSALLGTPVPANENDEQAADRRESAAKVSALVLANAFIFQEQLAATDERVSTLRTLLNSDDVVSSTAEHWRWIWQNINYVPIFQLGERVLNELPSGLPASQAVITLLREAASICNQQTALRHDLMGRIYHWLLHDAKYLGTYYTSVPAATLLLKLVMGRQWGVDFGDARSLADFKVVDLACGTGTLLMSAAQAIADKFIVSRAEAGTAIEARSLATLHSTLMQNVLYGYDILPTAVHLTASTLALLSPEIAFRQMNLFVMPVGMDRTTPRLGSIDFFAGQRLSTQFTLDDQVVDVVRTGAGRSQYTNAEVPIADLFVMNPPFVSNRYGNLIFGSHPQERELLKRELSRWATRFGVSATAGLGAVFVPLADLYVKEGGRLAFVLPLALATGEAWEPVRRLIADRYHLEIVIASHDRTRFNFSENTSLSEVLFVARRLRSGERPGKTAYVSLWQNPTTIYEALDTAHSVEQVIASLAENDADTAVVLSADRPIAEIAYRPGPVGGENWTPIIFAQSALAAIHRSLDRENALAIPGSGRSTDLPLCPLSDLGELGFDARDVADAFEADRTRTNWSAYSGFFDHDSHVVVTLHQQPNAYVHPRTRALPGRPLRSADRVWEKSSDLLLVSRLRTNTQKVIAVSLDVNVVGNTWWPLHHNLTSAQKKALVLWLNSTLGILLYYGRRAITEGAWVQMKKPAWTGMPVLNVLMLSEQALEELRAAYDRLSERELAPVAQLNDDQTRIEIDATLERVLGLSSLATVRELLEREPSFSGIEISPR